MNDVHFILPARSGLVYLLTLSRACESCDAPSGITIERFKSRKQLKDNRGFDELPNNLPFEKWRDCDGAAIITSHRKHEFVKAVKNSLIGLKSDDFADKPGQGFDDIAAETILEEMYSDSIVTPTLVEAKL
jgi:hypothetical protein